MLLSTLLAFALTVHLSDLPTLPSGERWLYEIETPREPGRKHRVEISIHADGTRQRAVIRSPGRSAVEIVARPRALLTTLLGPGRIAANEEWLLGELSWLFEWNGKVEVACRGGWSGEPWATGSSCGPLVIEGPCGAGGLTGVQVGLRWPGGLRGPSDVCMSKDLALPLATTRRARGGVRLEATLLTHDRDFRRQSSRPPPGLWVRPGMGDGLLIEGAEVSEVHLNEGVSPRTLCRARPLRYEVDGETLVVYDGVPLRHGGILVTGATELRLATDAAGRRLDSGSPNGTWLASLGAFRDVGPCAEQGAATLFDPGVPQGRDDLFAAVQRDDLPAVREMLERGVRPDPPAGGPAPPSAWIPGDGPRASLGRGHTPLRVAAAYGFTDIADLLLQHGADPNAGLAGPLPPRADGLQPDRGATPLLLAIDAGVPELVQLLLARGARWDLGGNGVAHAFVHGVESDRINAALIAAGAPGGYREVYDAVRKRDGAALRGALAPGRWASDALRLARERRWAEGTAIAEAALTPATPGAGTAR